MLSSARRANDWRGGGGGIKKSPGGEDERLAAVGEAREERSRVGLPLVCVSCQSSRVPRRVSVVR